MSDIHRKRVESELASILPAAIAAEIETEPFGLITVVRVAMIGDGTEVAVYLSALRNRNMVLEAIQERIFFIQGVANARLKRAPRLRFFLAPIADPLC